MGTHERELRTPQPHLYMFIAPFGELSLCRRLPLARAHTSCHLSVCNHIVFVMSGDPEWREEVAGLMAVAYVSFYCVVCLLCYVFVFFPHMCVQHLL